MYDFKYLELSSDIPCLKLNCNDTFASGLITFKTFMDSYSFWRRNIQCDEIEFSHTWYDSYSDEIQTKLLREIQLALNDDCIEEISKHLDFVGFADLLMTCTSENLKVIAGRKFVSLIINPTTVGRSFGVLNLYYVLYVLGKFVVNITIDLNSFRGGHRTKGNNKLMYSILYYVCNLMGPNLRSILLQKFEFDVNISYFRSLIDELQSRNVVLNIEP